MMAKYEIVLTIICLRVDGFYLPSHSRIALVLALLELRGRKEVRGGREISLRSIGE